MLQAQKQSHEYENWRHVSTISKVELLDQDGNLLDVTVEPYTAFAGYVSSRPTRLIASTLPCKDNKGKECVVVGINSRWNEKVVDLYENIYFEGVESFGNLSIKSYGAGVFPVEGWNFRDVSVQKERELSPLKITSFINFQHEVTGEQVSVRWRWDA